MTTAPDPIRASEPLTPEWVAHLRERAEDGRWIAAEDFLAILDERDALRADFDGLVGWLIAHCDHPTSAVMLDEDGESGRIRLWCERCQLEGPYLGRWLDDDEDAASPEQGL